MSYIYKTITYPPTPAKTITKVDHILCDVCKEATGFESYTKEIDWSPSSNSISTSALYMTTGWSTYDGGNEEKTSYHICPDCFEEQVVPFLNNIATTYKVEKDW